GCPICDAEMYAAYVGYFTIIDCGDVIRSSDGSVKLEGWKNREGKNFQFGKKLYGAKRGSKEKPGILQKLSKIAQRKCKGSLRGAVFDVEREGKLSEAIGNTFDLVEIVKENEIRDYLLNLGADPKYLNIDPFNYQEVFKPRKYED